jgi:hypothetical protein
VFGRMVSAELSFLHVTTLRFVVGLATLVVLALATRTPVAVPLELLPRVVLLALVPGLLALVLYYVGLRRTAAARATFAELASRSRRRRWASPCSAADWTPVSGRASSSSWSRSSRWPCTSEAAPARRSCLVDIPRHPTRTALVDRRPTRAIVPPAASRPAQISIPAR